MDNLIERYVYDVVRRLPEKDRHEVGKELKSNIYDMLSENADESEIMTILYKLGTPARLAEKYRQKPRYLISPSIYDEYIRVLKWILPLVGTVVLVIGMILGAIDAIQNGMVDLTHMIINILTKGISLGLSAAFQALIWTTVGFVIAERTSAQSVVRKEKEWKVEDLPDIPPDNRGRIPLSDGITELVMTIVFSVAAILVCSGVLPIPFIILNGDIQVTSLFNSSFLTGIIPAIVIMALFGICECIFKIKYRRWTPFVCGAVIASNIVNIGILVYIMFYSINRPDIFSAEFTALIKGIDWGEFDLPGFMGAGGINLVIVLTCLIIVTCSLAECFKAVYRTFKNKRPKELS